MLKQNKISIFLILISLFSIFVIKDVRALENTNIVDNEGYVMRLADEEEDDASSRNCQYIFGDPNDDGSVAWMFQKFFNYAKIIGPLLVLILSGLDFAKNTLISDEKAMKQATHKLVIRLLCAVGLYFVPLLASFILNLVNNTTGDQACGIK